MMLICQNITMWPERTGLECGNYQTGNTSTLYGDLGWGLLMELPGGE